MQIAAKVARMGTKNRLAGIKTDHEKDRLSADDTKRLIAGSDLSPKDLLLAVLRDDSLPLAVRIDAAKAAAPYEHQKKPLAIEGTDKPLVITQDELRGLSRQELVTMQELLAKAGVTLANSETSH